MSYDVLDIKKERELCSVGGKKTWDEIQGLIKEMNLSKTEEEALIQRQMASLRYIELKNENQYLSKGLGEDTQNIDVYAQRKINKNKLEMQRMLKVYQNNSQKVAHTEPKLNEKKAELLKKKQEQINQAQRKTGK